MNQYTVRIQQRPGAMYTPVYVRAESVHAAIREAADRMALHGDVHSVDVYPGHDGWYATSERIWSGSLEWSQISDAECRIIDSAVV